MRLHYLDWLRVVAILVVFLFHAVHPFDQGEWHIKNVEQSLTLTIILTILGMWGMCFFFLVAGAGSWFALQRRTARQYVSERFKRLLIPYFFGLLLFMPFTFYLEWKLNVSRGLVQESYLAWLSRFPIIFSPRMFGWGQHLWFLGFLFSFALITLPLFLWLKTPLGQRLVSRIGHLVEHRGGALLFILPLTLVQFALRPFFPYERDWAGFVFWMSFFALGHVLYADERLTRAIRRDGWLFLAVGIVAVVLLLVMYGLGVPLTIWSELPTTPGFYLVWAFVTTIALCWTLAFLFIGMRFLDFSNAVLRYSREAVLPFFVVHQPVIIVIAFFVVQWEASIPIKMLAVMASAFVVSVGLYELVVRRIGPLRAFFGMTPRRLDKAKIGTG